MDDNALDVLDVLDVSYDIVENSDLDEQIVARDPDEPDALERWSALRARYQKPEPRPRQRRLDTRPLDMRGWETWADARIAAFLEKRERAYDKAVGRAIGQATAKLEDKIATLRGELAMARTRIKELEQQRNVEIRNWHVNRKTFSATPFDANGKAGTPINLRPLFEEYHVQTS